MAVVVVVEKGDEKHGGGEAVGLGPDGSVLGGEVCEPQDGDGEACACPGGVCAFPASEKWGKRESERTDGRTDGPLNA